MLGKIANNCNFIKTEKLKIGADIPNVSAIKLDPYPDSNWEKQPDQDSQKWMRIHSPGRNILVKMTENTNV